MDVTQIMLISLFCLIGFAYSAGEWGYDVGTPGGPNNWKNSYPKCGGKQQSPINIVTNDVEYSDLPKIELGDNWDMLLNFTSLIIGNTGYTAAVSVVDGRPVLTKQGDKTWRLDQLRFHWGSNSNKGSEHTIDGKSYPGELHFVHYQTTYSSLSAALPMADGLMVLGFFLKVDDSALVGSTLRNFMEFDIPSVKYKGDGRYMTPLKRSLYDIIQSDSVNKYYHYPGSNTIPSCEESVTWNVMHPENSLIITSAMMNNLRALSQKNSSSTFKSMSGNYRPVLPLNGRVVKRNFEKSSASTALSSIMSFTIPMFVIAFRLV